MDINSDGWVPNEDWDIALEVNRAAYNLWMETVRWSEAEGEMEAKKANRLRPFDARWSVENLVGADKLFSIDFMEPGINPRYSWTSRPYSDKSPPHATNRAACRRQILMCLLDTIIASNSRTF